MWGWSILWSVALVCQALNAFSLQDHIKQGHNGDYVVFEQGGMVALLMIREHRDTQWVLEEIAAPLYRLKELEGGWKGWVLSGAPGHTSWVSYTMDLSRGRLVQCYSYGERAWLDIPQEHHLLSRLLALPLRATARGARRRVGPEPSEGEDDRRALWKPQVVVEGHEDRTSSVTAWSARWPKENGLMSECDIEIYLSTPTFPVWVEVRNPHYRVCLKALDSGEGMVSPQNLLQL